METLQTTKLVSWLEGQVDKKWLDNLRPFLLSDYMTELADKIKRTRDIKQIYPPTSMIFRAFKETPLDNVKVVILGQDPYHDGSATGIAFSNEDKIGNKPSPSLRNILKEVESDIYNGFNPNSSPDLLRWAHQGVLLLNTALTVNKGEPDSHTEGWKPFTQEVLKVLSRYHVGIIYILWGKKSQSFLNCIDRDTNFILIAPHPAAEVYAGGKAGFFGCKHFSQANEILTEIAVAKELEPDKYIIKW